MLSESFSAAAEDVHARALREEQVEAKRLIEAVESALLEDSHLLDEDEQKVITRKVTALSETMEITKDAQVLRRAVESLSKATDEFAARRMNQSIRKALAGKKVEEI
jgi:molecular chaperone HscA